jgi:superfamily I DNA and/or RNA helicase
VPCLLGCTHDIRQATEPATLVPLTKGAQCVVMAGDPRQLPPTVVSRKWVAHHHASVSCANGCKSGPNDELCSSETAAISLSEVQLPKSYWCLAVSITLWVMLWYWPAQPRRAIEAQLDVTLFERLSRRGSLRPLLLDTQVKLNRPILMFLQACSHVNSQPR